MTTPIAQGPVGVNVRHELDKFLDEAAAKATEGRCEGNCQEHRGSVKVVRVSHILSGTDWGYFAYCEEALETDAHNGMRCIDA